jgi:glycosyltransferase involved in cell wall biosynthesis
MLKRIRSIKQQSGIHPNQQAKIYLLHGDLTPTEMNGLYNHPKVKAMVSLTHGEGFGRPLLEFSVTGKPVIVSDWSGHTDFLPNNNTFKLPGELKEVDKSAIQEDVIIEGSKWFYVNYGYASNVIKNVYRKYKDYLLSSRKQRKYVKDNFSLDYMTEEFTRIIQDTIPEPVKLNLPKLKLPKLEKVNE